MTLATTLRRHGAALLLAAPLVLGFPGTARAIDVPGIDGHMTDPGRVLGTSDKNAVEDKLSKLQQDTRIDVAGWIVDAQAGALDDLGHKAFQKWNIGGDWDGAVFFVIPRVGRVRLIQNDAKPELSAQEASKIVAADKPNAPMLERLDLIIDATGEIVRKKTLRARPPGQKDPRRGLWFSAAWGVLFLGVVAVTMRTRRALRAG